SKGEFGIVGKLSPLPGHPSRLERRAGPGFIARLARTRDEGVTPQLLAGLCIVSRDVAAKARVLAGAAGNDHAVEHDRTSGVADEQISATVGLPGQLSGPRLESDDEIVPSHEIDVIAIDGDAALALPQHPVKR